MQASDQVFLSSDGRSWTARITVEGCTSESEALAAVARATRAALGNAADDEADAGRRRKKRPKQDVGPLPDDAANLLREYCRRENKDVAFGRMTRPIVPRDGQRSKHRRGARPRRRPRKRRGRGGCARFCRSELATPSQRWRERCSTDVVDMIGRLGSSIGVLRRPGASEDRAVAIRDHLNASASRRRAAADRRGWRPSRSGRGPAAECGRCCGAYGQGSPACSTAPGIVAPRLLPMPVRRGG